VRGPNTAGDCAPVAFQFTLDPGVASFIVSDGAKGGQGVAVEYVILWPSSTTTDNWSDARPKLAWGVPGNTQPPAEAFVPALACLYDPADPSGLTMDVMPLIPTTGPTAALYQAAVAAGYSQYSPGTTENPNKAKVCVAQHGWTASGDKTLGKIQYWDKIIDLADAWVLPH
jgi:hypothetical protein